MDEAAANRVVVYYRYIRSIIYNIDVCCTSNLFVCEYNIHNKDDEDEKVTLPARREK